MNEQKCKYCSKGQLKTIAWPLSRDERSSYMGSSPPGSITRLGLREVAGQNWTVLRCGECGFTAWFLNKS